MKKNGMILCAMLLGCTLFAMGKGETPTNENVITIGTSASYKPWAYQEKDVVKGFEIDVWNEIAKRNGLKLEMKLGKFSGLVGMLDAGEIDSVAHQMSITPARLEKYLFSSPYAYSYYDFFVKKGSDIKTLDDLKQKRVGCWLGGNGEKTLREINEKYHLNLDIVTYDGAPMEREVLLGRIDAFWQGEVKTLTVVKDENLDLTQLHQRLTYEVNAYPFRKDARGEKLSAMAKKTIDEMRKDGTLKKLSEKWFSIDVTQEAKKIKRVNNTIYFDVRFALQLVPGMLKYAGVTLRLSMLAIVCGLALAFLIAFIIDAKVPLLSAFFRLYVSFFRGTPLMAQLFCFYFGVLPLMGSMVQRVSSFSAALIVLSLASSAYMSESLRAAFSSIEKGQMEAAYSVGMTYMQAMRFIILPQAIRVALPTLFSSFINIIKDTSLVFAIGVKEMMAQAQLEGSSGYRYLEAYVCVLFVYWAITAILGKVQKRLEKKFSKGVGLDG